MIKFDEKRFVQDALKAVHDDIRKRIQHVRCSAHGRTAKVVFTKSGGGKTDYRIDGCCEVLIEKVKRVLGS